MRHPLTYHPAVRVRPCVFFCARAQVAVDFSRLCAERGCGKNASAGAPGGRAGEVDHAAAKLLDGRASRHVGLALHRLVTADVLIMSRSALSYAAAMLTNGTVFFPSCWLEHRRALPSWRMWPCCPAPEGQPKAGRCKGDTWKRTWKDMRRLKYS